MAIVRFPLRIAALGSLVVGIGLTSSPALAQQRVGVNAAVNPAATGSPPGAAARRLVLGQEVVFKEHVITDLQGQTQILFVDQSTMTVGPNSDLQIDEFVFDPAAGTGKMAANLTRGVFRFVGGKLSKLDNAVSMQTPTATIGIRGGVILIKQADGGALEVIFVYGKGVTVTGLNGVAQTITAPGWEVTVSGPGAAPSEPAPAPPGAAAGLLAQLDGRSGGNGGASTVPTEIMVADSGIAQAIQQGPQLVTTQTQTQQPPSVSNAVQLAQTQIQVAANQPQVLFMPTPAPVPAPAPVVIPPPPPPPVSVTYAGIFKSTNGGSATLGFVGQNSPAQIAFTNAILTNNVLTISGSALGDTGPLTIPLVPGTATFTSANTASPLGPVSGTSFLSTDGTFFYANLTPVNSPTQREFVAGGLPVSANALAATGSTRIVAFTVQPDAALQSNIPFIRNNTGGNLANAYVSPLYLVAPANAAIGEANARSRTLQASLAITGQGANQQSVLVTSFGSALTLQSSGQPAISGVVRGTSQLSPTSPPVRIGSAFSSTVDGNNNSLYGGANAISGFALDQTNYNSANGQLTTPVIPSTASEVPLSGGTTNYGFTQPATAASLPSGVGASRTTQTLTGYFGGVMNTTAQTQPYATAGLASVSTDATNNRVAATLTSDPQISSALGTTTNVKMEFGGFSGSAGMREAFIDDKIYGTAESVTQAQQINGQDLVVGGDTAQAGKLYLLSSGAAPPPTSLLPSGASYCQCQYLQWGYWGGDLRTGNSTNDNISRVDRGGINFWAAGQITPLADINLLAGQAFIGTYNGHMIGSVFNNGAQYVAAGGMSATYNFGTQSGSFAVNNYDGRSFTLTGTPLTSQGGRSYQFGITGVPGITGAVSGSFYGPMAAETGGNFAFKTTAGPTYLTSGIFAAKR